MSSLNRLFLILTLLVTGAVIMILEILGTKVISPFFGVSLYVWSSLITVTLLSLAIGYWVGGILADQRPKASWLYSIVFLTGLTVAFIPPLAPAAIRLAEPLELRLGTLTATFLLFFLPLFGLGIVSPFAIKLQTNKIEVLGVTAGSLYAISTFGSFVGTLLAGFVLIPTFPVSRIFFLVSTILVVLGFVGLWVSRNVRASLVLSAVLLAAIGCLVFLSHPKNVEAEEAQIIHQSDNFYGQIKVVDFRDVRSLLVNGSPQNFVPKESNGSLFDQSPYVVYLTTLLIYRPQIQKILMIGLGGGTLPSMLSRYGAVVDVIEIDPRMERIAKKYFNYQSGKGRVFVGDGRYTMKRLKEKYDALILDAFSSYDQPSHLFTREMFTEMKNVLKEDGVLGINSAGFVHGKASRVSKAILRTLKEVFSYVEAFHIEGKQRVGSVIFFASNSPLYLAIGSSRLPLNDQIQLIRTLDESHANEDLQGGILLTDNYNPLSYWGVPIYCAWRQEVIKFFGKKVLQKI